MRAAAAHPTDVDLLLVADRALSTRRHTNIVAHLAACEDCRARHDRLREAERTSRACLRVEAPNADARARERLQGAIARVSFEGRPPQWRRTVAQFQLLPFLATAAAIVACVLGGRVFFASASGGAMPPAFERGALPVARLTPGVASTAREEEMCAGRVSPVPRVSSEMRAEVLRTYGMESTSVDDYELDYLITPELGGATDARNLWPQRYGARVWNAHAKDDLERRLPALVCSGRIDLPTAHRAIAENWIAAYRTYINPSGPLASAFDERDDDEDPLAEARRGFRRQHAIFVMASAVTR